MANSVTTEFYIFTTRDAPTSTLSISSPVNQQNPTFTGGYSQAQGTLLRYYYYKLYNNSNNLLVQSKNLYDGLLSYQFEGLSNNTNYKAEQIVVSQDNLSGSSGMISFSVSYVQASASRAFDAIELPEEGAVRLIWSNTKQILGKLTTGSPVYIGDTLELQDGQVLYYDANLKLPQHFTYFNRLSIPNTFTSGTILEFTHSESEDRIEFGYTGERFYLRTWNGLQWRIIGSNLMSLPSGIFLLVIIHNKVYMKIGGAIHQF